MLPEGLPGHPLPDGATVARRLAPVSHFPFAGRHVGYSDLVETRTARGRIFDGPCAIWFRLRHPLLDGETPSAYQRVAVAADSGNGISAVLDYERYSFVNSDLTIHLLRPPVGEWICLDARTWLGTNGCGLAESALYDTQGLIGRATQSLAVRVNDAPAEVTLQRRHLRHPANQPSHNPTSHDHAAQPHQTLQTMRHRRGLPPARRRRHQGARGLPGCNTVHYENPLNVVGTVPHWGDKVLLCKRNIEPRWGKWTLPAGFMELDETTAARCRARDRRRSRRAVRDAGPVHPAQRGARGPGAPVLPGAPAQRPVQPRHRDA